MLGWLQGQIIDKSHPGKLVVNVHGVGYDVETSLNTFFAIESSSLNDNNVQLHIHTVVREDALLLYGFADKTERTLFRALLKVNGVGPKVAINILSSIMPAEFVQCIQEENIVRLTKLPGVGKKTAERLIMEMKGSKLEIMESFPLSFKTNTMSAQDEAISALEALGYKYPEAKKIIYQIDAAECTTQQLIRLALQKLSVK